MDNIIQYFHIILFSIAKQTDRTTSCPTSSSDSNLTLVRNNFISNTRFILIFTVKHNVSQLFIMENTSQVKASPTVPTAIIYSL